MLRSPALILLTQVALSGPDSRANHCASPAAAAAADALAVKFVDHQFIFIGSTHGDLKIEEFLTCLVTRPAFTQRVTDIVTEWASAGQQRLLDRYVMSLEDIGRDDLTPIWLDTDAPTMWTTLPQVRRTLETLREVNKGLPLAKRIRLVGGNEPTDWSKVRVVEDLAPYPFKTNFMIHLLNEHLAKEPETERWWSMAMAISAIKATILWVTSSTR